MEDENNADTTGTAPDNVTNEPSQDPLEQELTRETNKGTRSEAEKAAFSLKKNAERVKELGIDPLEILGAPNVPQRIEDSEDNAPLTVGMYKQMQRSESKKTAIELADSIQDAHERNLVKQYLEHRIIPSGDPQEDIRFARLAVNSVKNTQVVAELNRGIRPASHASGAGAPPMTIEKAPELTPDELQFTRAPFNLTAAEIISKRPKN